MSDDEEVVLQSSELHKYFATNHFDALINNDCKVDDSGLTYRSDLKEYSFQNNKIIDEEVNNTSKKPKLSSHTSAIINTLLNTGLMYPDHVVDIEVHLGFQNVNPQLHTCTKNSVICFTILLSCSTAPVAVLHKKLRIYHYVSILASSFYFSYRIYNNLKMLYERRKMKCFTSTIERLFYIIKKALSFVYESEFLVKTKMVKEQLFYVPGNGWVNSNTAEGLKYSGLILPELRSTLAAVLVDVIFIFDRLTNYMRTILMLLPNVDYDNCYSEIPDSSTLKEMSVNPSLEDLKKLNSIYLIAQSEFLRRLILSLVEDFWIDCNSHSRLKNIFNETNNVTNKFKLHIKNIESLYECCTKINANKISKIERNKEFKVRNMNDKVFISVRNFLTKAEAHALSLSIDLKMLNDWMKEYKENNKEVVHNSRELLQIFHDRLTLMKNNIESFATLYNDNCDILKSMIADNLPDNNDKCNISSIDNKPAEGVRKTGIEVGKSDFDFTGEDEVLISLCNNNYNSIVSKDNNLEDDYYEDGVKKYLPKSVLRELKCALKGKKEEWMEREKKAIKSNVSIDKLDCDTLSNKMFDDIICNQLTEENHIKIDKSNRSDCTKHDEYYSEDEDSLSHCKKVMSSTMYNDNFCTLSTFKSEYEDLCSECGISNADSESSFLKVDNNNDFVNKNGHNSFSDQIRLAQKSFNLRLNEEEFIDNTSDCFEDGD